MYLKCMSATNAYECIIEQLKYDGQESNPRGMKIKEIINCCIEIENPLDRIVQTPRRRFGMAYAIGELLWYLSGRNDLETMKYYSKNMDKFSDDGKTLNSAYGYRIFGKHNKIGFNQWENVKNLIKIDPDTRQAIIHLHTPNDKKTKDEVCTLSLQFFVRNGKLSLIVNMRSNDIVLGFTYDVFAFTMLQEIMANELGLEVGTYYHNAGSMHIYEQHFDMLVVERTKSFPMNRNMMVLGDYKPLIEAEKLLRESPNAIAVYSTDIKDSEFELVALAVLLFKATDCIDKDSIKKQYIRNEILNRIRQVNEMYADIVANRCKWFGNDGIKIIIEGIDGTGKTRLANSLARKDNMNLQHYGRPSANFHYYDDYCRHIESNVDVIFDRFFYSEVVYSTSNQRSSGLSNVECELLEMKLGRKGINAVLVFMIPELHKNHVYNEWRSRLSREDSKLMYDQVISMNIHYEELAHNLKIRGYDVIIVDDLNYDMEELKQKVYNLLDK